MILDLIIEWGRELGVVIALGISLGLALWILKYVHHIKLMATEAKLIKSKSSIEQKMLSVQAHSITVEALVLAYLEQRQRDPLRHLDHTLFLRDEEKDAVIKDLSRSRDILFHADRLLVVELNKIEMTDGELVDLDTLANEYLTEVKAIEKRIKDLLQEDSAQPVLSKSL